MRQGGRWGAVGLQQAERAASLARSALHAPLQAAALLAPPAAVVQLAAQGMGGSRSVDAEPSASIVTTSPGHHEPSGQATHVRCSHA